VPPGVYDIDTFHSQLGFAVTHLGLSLVRGTFDRYSGSLRVGESLATTSVAIEADLTSVASGHPAREDFLQGEDYFDSANHPMMSFASTSVSAAGDGYEMLGALTIRGVTQPVTFLATYNGSALFPMDGSTHHGFSARGAIKRSDFGMSSGIPMVSDEVDVSLEVQFVDPPSE
jgi:polyisoprenoid-binding protein YceI